MNIVQEVFFLFTHTPNISDTYGDHSVWLL